MSFPAGLLGRSAGTRTRDEKLRPQGILQGVLRRAIINRTRQYCTRQYYPFPPKPKAPIMSRSPFTITLFAVVTLNLCLGTVAAAGNPHPFFNNKGNTTKQSTFKPMNSKRPSFSPNKYAKKYPTKYTNKYPLQYTNKYPLKYTNKYPTQRLPAPLFQPSVVVVPQKQPTVVHRPVITVTSSAPVVPVVECCQPKHCYAWVLPGESLDQVCLREYGDASLWPQVVKYNKISGPLSVDVPVMLPNIFSDGRLTASSAPAPGLRSAQPPAAPHTASLPPAAPF